VTFGAFISKFEYFYLGTKQAKSDKCAGGLRQKKKAQKLLILVEDVFVECLMLKVELDLVVL